MNRYLSCVALSAALALPGLAMARPVTLSTTLKNYGGDGAYLALYVTDASGAYVRTLWVAGEKSKYYKHLTDWYRATSGAASQINGITGASVGAGRTLKVTVDLEDALLLLRHPAGSASRGVSIPRGQSRVRAGSEQTLTPT